MGRTVFAMASRGDAPRFFAAAGRRRIPIRAEVAAALATTVLVIAGGLTLALAVSATMILTYYSIAHVSALRMARMGGSRFLGGVGSRGARSRRVRWTRGGAAVLGVTNVTLALASTCACICKQSASH